MSERMGGAAIAEAWDGPDPVGGDRFRQIAAQIGELVATKNQAYGDSFSLGGDVLRILYPNGVRPDQFDDMLGVSRVIDKLFRIATDRDALGESPWRDIAGYGVLGAARERSCPGK
jgi:hypothetical protein